jgi:hypothetical protein
MQQNFALLAAMVKEKGGNGGGSGGASGGGGGGGNCGCGGGGSGNKRPDKDTKAIHPNCNKVAVYAASDWFTLPANKDKILTWYKPYQLD